jgi:hypothetical protein
MLSSIHGMGADQILSLQMIINNGAIVPASPTQNVDLLWALGGGGAGTFGVVTSMIVKAYKDVHTTVGTMEWSVQGNNISVDTFWAGVSSYFSHFESLSNQGTAAEWSLYPRAASGNRTQPDGKPRLQINAFFAPGKTLEETKDIIAPWITEMRSIGIDVTMDLKQFPSYYDAYYSTFPPSATNLMPFTMGYASRLIPRENFNKTEKLNSTIKAFRSLAEADHTFHGYQYAPTVKAGAPVSPIGNSVHPAWRNALSHTIIFVNWPSNITKQEQLKIRNTFATEEMQIIRDVTPGAGSYMNEGDRLEPDFQQSFYGKNYAELLRIKKKFDPTDVFWAATAVGSEGWAVRSADGLPTENGPLCRTTEIQP